MEIPRRLDLSNPAKSILLFGPRQTGKTWLLRHQLPEAPFRRRILACAAPRPSLARGIEVMSVSAFFEELWSGKI